MQLRYTKPMACKICSENYYNKGYQYLKEFKYSKYQGFHYITDFYC